MKKQFEKHIQSLINKESTFIFKTNLELLRLFYNTMYSLFNDEELCNLYLELFSSISEITSNNIESNFSNLIIESKLDLFSIDEFRDKQESGIYFIFNDLDNLIYIGKTTNLSLRPLQSFINKIPYGAKYIKFYELPELTISLFESIAIDYYLPMYNNKKEDIPKMTYRNYAKYLGAIKEIIDKSEKIYPININEEFKGKKRDRVKELLEKRKQRENERFN